VLAALDVPVSRHTALCVLLRIPLPAVTVPRVLGVDDLALRRSRSYATVLIDALTGQRVDVLPGRTADVVETWLRDHPACRSCAATARAPMPRRSAARCPARCRSATAGSAP
jgi:transposase